MNILLAAIPAMVLAAGAAIALAPSAEIRTEIDINASTDSVWAVLTDAARYREWNPFLVDMKGEIVKGGRLENTMNPAGDKQMVFRPIILEARPGRELRWLGRLGLPRLFDGEHYFLLEPSGTGTRLIHGERFRGVLLWVLSTDGFSADFERMNMALKARAEALPERS